ncbi:hypothetical protein K493DRAFT_355522 [Basidiobolus meristosporus CBS 931.73]|uniref:Peptidase C51 domain-containing protein n=1 Tax=Basidiobolus meristosporus CBS 931.73 TaxID=1314790 RepID=A0A1Y1Y0C7_9FUNG|nr:hypothetical protein K493DRAFT_355522 [Basidiobolus meristosporus CBS 931.73]|eukprot:ORX91473.1 hypothetical protein K493DRAFT_355522 [Basidiobolus meristosporus CBS 931.73]
MFKALLFLFALACCRISVTSARINCPDGNGLYCGSVLGLKQNTLYDCKSDRWSWSYHPVERCANGCVVAKAGTPDSCGKAEPPKDDNDVGNPGDNGDDNGNDNGSNNDYTDTTNVANYPLEFRFRNGQCTDWADARYAQITGHHISWWGDARLWSSRARSAGWSVSKTPRVPSIIVIQAGYQGTGGPGHVAVVERINNDGSVYTSNYNYRFNGNGGPYIKSYGTFRTGNGVDFIWYK